MNRTIALSVLAAVASCFVLSGCPVGQCRYGKIPVREGIVTIRAIEKIQDGNRELMKLSVQGMFTRDLYLTPEEYGKCIAGRGYTVGSTLTGIIVPGGPCPPMYYLNECR
ncbi:MAG: hypothetical protein JXA20_09790 [Spirochaetes bacterium]|nr:hypothetical protein [Spirochaetota bacterium]